MLCLEFICSKKKNDWDYILSTTGDNPFVDQNWAYKLLKHHIKKIKMITLLCRIYLMVLTV